MTAAQTKISVKKTKRGHCIEKKKKYSNIYFALFVCLAAVAVGSIVSVKTAITKKKPEETGFTRVTYKWTVPATEEKVNAEQTGVEDNRLRSAGQSTEAIERNKPYSGDFAPADGLGYHQGLQQRRDGAVKDDGRLADP